MQKIKTLLTSISSLFLCHIFYSCHKLGFCHLGVHCFIQFHMTTCWEERYLILPASWCFCHNLNDSGYADNYFMSLEFDLSLVSNGYANWIMVCVVWTVSMNYWYIFVTWIKEIGMVYQSALYMWWLMDQLCESHCYQSLYQSIRSIFIVA